MGWVRRMFCAHDWRKALSLVVLGTGEPLTNAKRICLKCGTLSHKDSTP